MNQMGCFQMSVMVSKSVLRFFFSSHVKERKIMGDLSGKKKSFV